MQIRLGFYVVAGWLCLTAPLAAQFKEGEPSGIKTGESKMTRWQVGAVVKASGGACKTLSGYVPVPTNWPEQQVTTVAEDVGPEAKISFDTVDGGVRIMNIRIGYIPTGQTVKVLQTFEIRRSVILPPEKTDNYVIPDPKKLPRDIHAYLLPSPKIESRDPKIRELAKTVGVDKEKAWDHVEAIYDWVRQKVQYKKNMPLRGALAALKDGTGDCEDMTSLVIAICRAADIPARTVWVPGHCYPEFYLEDEQGKGHWFPCQISGSREFGGIKELRPILQKGDNFRPPRGGRDRQRYMAEHLSGKPAPGGGTPQVQFVRQQVFQ